jgi:hypothetical protein
MGENSAAIPRIIVRRSTFGPLGNSWSMGASYFMKQLHTAAFNRYALTIHESGSISKETLGVRSRPNPLN